VSERLITDEEVEELVKLAECLFVPRYNCARCGRTSEGNGDPKSCECGYINRALPTRRTIANVINLLLPPLIARMKAAEANEDRLKHTLIELRSLLGKGEVSTQEFR